MLARNVQFSDFAPTKGNYIEPYLLALNNVVVEVQAPRNSECRKHDGQRHFAYFFFVHLTKDFRCKYND
jgi:hypothetical protein